MPRFYKTGLDEHALTVPNQDEFSEVCMGGGDGRQAAGRTRRVLA